MDHGEDSECCSDSFNGLKAIKIDTLFNSVDFNGRVNPFLLPPVNGYRHSVLPAYGSTPRDTDDVILHCADNCLDLHNYNLGYLVTIKND